METDISKNPQTAIKMAVLIMFISMILTAIPITTAYDTDQNGGMPNYAGPLSITDHYLIITQKSATELTVEELIWYQNDGSENFTGHVFVWFQSYNIEAKITQFGYMVGGNFNGAKVYPSSHSPNFIYGNLSEENITVAPGESIQTVFKYDIKYTSAEEFDYSRTFLYDNKNVIIVIEPFDDYVVEGKENIEVIFDENSNTYITSHTVSSSRVLGDYITITFKEDSSSSNGGDDDDGDDGGVVGGLEDNSFVIIIVVLVVIGIVLSILMSRKSGSKKKK